MTRSLLSASLALGVPLLLAACAGARFQSAAGRFGAETEKTMASQSGQIEKVGALETQRLRDAILADNLSLGLSEDCLDVRANAQGRFKPCELVTPQAGSDENRVVAFHYDLPAILDLQHALAGYGANLAELADAAEGDQAAFSASVDKLGASLGKLDSAIGKATGADRIDPAGKITRIASAIGALGNLAFTYQRRHALRRIIVANDALVQEALEVLRSADQGATEYKRLAALRVAQSASAKARLAATDDERRKLNEELYRSVDLVNEIESNAPRLEKLAAVHNALATLARDPGGGTRRALAQAMITDWTSEEEKAP